MIRFINKGLWTGVGGAMQSGVKSGACTLYEIKSYCGVCVMCY